MARSPRLHSSALHSTPPHITPRYGLFFGQESRRAASSVKHKQRPSSAKQQQQQQQQHIREAYDSLFSHTSVERVMAGGRGGSSQGHAYRPVFE